MEQNDKIKDRLAKVLELVNRGSEGEKQNAQMALERLMKKYNISMEELETIHLKMYRFKYATSLDLKLFQQLLAYYFRDKDFTVYKDTFYKKEIVIELEYLDYVTLSASYEYFRRHMNSQWKKFSSAALKRKRKAKTKAKLREELYDLFYSQYIIKSG